MIFDEKLRLKEFHDQFEDVGKIIKVDLASPPKGYLKPLGGGSRDEWNERLSNLVVQALPVDQNNLEACTEAATAALSGLADINPADPVEGMLIAQMIVANDTALKLYRRAWLNMTDLNGSTSIETGGSSRSS